MRLVGRDRTGWLAYGMNVHPGGSPEALESALVTTVGPLRERLAADGPFGLALRLDREGVEALAHDEEAAARLRDLFRALDLVPFTANAFVVGGFHEAGTKASVYRPTWADPARARYTLEFARVLASLAPPGLAVSLSTAPLSFRPFDEPPGFLDEAARALAGAGAALAELADETGTAVRLAIEPEPLCTLQTTDDALAFFAGPLDRALRGAPGARPFLGVCYDVCHQAVMGEDPDAGLRALVRAGVPVFKVQLSSALVVPDPSDAAHRLAVARFDEGRWLHQVAAGSPTRVVADLADALVGPDAEALRAAGPWRVHCHVPVFLDALSPPLETTQPALRRAIGTVVDLGLCEALEIETYTFDGLPPEVRAGGLVASLAAEYAWVLGELARHGVATSEEDSP